MTTFADMNDKQKLQYMQSMRRVAPELFNELQQLATEMKLGTLSHQEAMKRGTDACKKWHDNQTAYFIRDVKYSYGEWYECIDNPYNPRRHQVLKAGDKFIGQSISYLKQHMRDEGWKAGRDFESILEAHGFQQVFCKNRRGNKGYAVVCFLNEEEMRAYKAATPPKQPVMVNVSNLMPKTVQQN